MEERMAAGDLSATETWKRYDWEFHQALISACGSPVLMQVHGSVFDKYLRYQMIALSFRGAVAAEEHRLLLEHALRRDTAAAQRVLARHLAGGVEHAQRAGCV
jgi:DNA-binding GntR family transcriptional regulator